MREGDIVLVKRIPGLSGRQCLVYFIEYTDHGHGFIGSTLDSKERTKHYLFTTWQFSTPDVLAIVEDGR